MSRVVLSTSSCGLDNFDIPHSVELIRVHIYINGVDLLDGKDITSEHLQYLIRNKLVTSPITISPATREEVALQFSSLYERGVSEVFITTLSSRMSESYHIISDVAKDFADRMKIHVYDCKDVSVCEAMLALEADSMRNEIVTLEGIATRLDNIRRNHKTLCAVNDLSSMIQSKQISAISGFFLNLCNLKPLFIISDEGETVPIKRIRNIENAYAYIIEEFAEMLTDSKRNTGKLFPYILSAGDKDMEVLFTRLLKERLGIDNLPILSGSVSSIVTHGPSVIGLCFFKDDIPVAKAFYTTI